MTHSTAPAEDAAADAEALIGRPWTDADTPALVVDLDRLERNIATMAALARDRGLDFRPHFKTHKSVEIARRQMAAGALGMTVAKLDEATVLIDAGIDRRADRLRDRRAAEARAGDGARGALAADPGGRYSSRARARSPAPRPRPG